MMQLFLALGADAYVQNRYGYNALRIAQMHGYNDAIQLLLEYSPVRIIKTPQMNAKKAEKTVKT